LTAARRFAVLTRLILREETGGLVRGLELDTGSGDEDDEDREEEQT
jgi:hypothetical protein